MEMNISVSRQPAVVLWLVGVEIIENDVDFTPRIGLDNTVHEIEKFYTAAALVLFASDLAGGNIERSKQRAGSVTGVGMRLSGQGASVGQFQVTLPAFERLDRGFSSTQMTSAFSGGPI